VNTTEPTTTETKQTSSAKSTLTAVAVIQPTVLPELSTIADAATSQSENLLDDSVRHLHSLMKALTKTEASNEVRLADVDRVVATVGVAKEIRELMRLRLDLIKHFQGAK
jgi:hypothetical protein